MYHVSAALYFDGGTALLDKPIDLFSFVAVEKTPPYFVQVYIADQNFLNLGRSKARQLLKLYHKCVTENKWPSYPPEIKILGVPKWAQ